MKKDLQWWLDHTDPEARRQLGPKDYLVRCPAHPDNNPSLHINDVKGRTLVECKAGCDFKSVVEAAEEFDVEGSQEAVSITRRSKASSPSAPPPSHGKVASREDYCAEKQLDRETVDELLGAGEGVVFPFPDGATKTRYVDGFAWSKGGKPAKWPLWPAPEECGEEIWICEGETDALTLRQLGYEAYAITSGAGGQTSNAMSSERFAELAELGAQTVVICCDADETGRDASRDLVLNARAAGLAVKELRIEGYNFFIKDSVKDVNDVWQSCATEDEFHELLAQWTIEYPTTPLFTGDVVEQMAEEEVPFLVQELLSPNEKMLIVGEQKSYKTWIALHLMHAVHVGGKFLQHAEWSVADRHPVLMVQEEGHKVKFAKRMVAIWDGKLDTDVHLWFKAGFNLLDDTQMDRLIEYVREHGIEFVVLDPLQRMMPGVDENSATEQRAVWDNIHRLANHCAVCVVHHANKQDNETWRMIRGSSRTGGEVDFAIFVKKNGSLLMEMDGRDFENDERGRPEIDMSDGPAKMKVGDFKVTINKNRQEAEILELGEFNTQDVMELLGVRQQAARKRIDRLEESGLIERLETGVGGRGNAVRWRVL